MCGATRKAMFLRNNIESFLGLIAETKRRNLFAVSF